MAGLLSHGEGPGVVRGSPLVGVLSGGCCTLSVGCGDTARPTGGALDSNSALWL